MRNHADRIFAAALDLEGEERQRFIARSCAGETALREVVDGLLRANEEDSGAFLAPGGALQGPLWEELASGFASGPELRSGDRIGAYRIIRELGRGGMAVVFLAERADGQFEQQVALKLLKHDRASEELTLRFHQERQILATLNHPAIARLTDGGVTADGRPYIIMEQVDGEPIDRYCDEHRLTVEERLGFFLEVVRAVHYAHQNLVVHRDLKPSNILVTREGRVKLLDFGIAKMLDDRGDLHAAPTTRDSIRVLTPEYASPEQVLGDPITTASDVYQLGLLLYELLSGHRPYHIRRRTPSEVERLICEQDPPPPSAAPAFTDDGDADGPPPETVGELRRTRPERLRRRLAGDLDTIVMMALRKDPQRRYGSAEELARDIERHLSGQPVLARKDTLGYRLRKLLRRHRAAVAASLAMILTIATVVGLAVVRLARERDRARIDAEKAAEVSCFLEELFQVADSSLARGEEISAQEILDRGAQRVSTELADKPAIQAEMQTLLGNIYSRLGLYDKAGSMLQQALDARNDLAGPEQLSLAVSLHSLAAVYVNQGRHVEATPLMERALDIHERLLDPDDIRLAVSRCTLAGNYLRRGRAAESEQLMELSYGVLSRQLGAEHPDVLQSLAVLRLSQHRYDEARVLSERVLGIRERALGRDHPDLVPTLDGLSLLYLVQGKWAEADALHRRIVAVLERTLGPNHPYLGAALCKLADTSGKLGSYREAEQLFRRALAIQGRTLAPDHPSMLRTLSKLASYLGMIGGYAESEQLALRALAICEESPGAFGARPRAAALLNNLAHFAAMQGKLDTAESYCRSGLQIWEELGTENVTYGVTLDTLACLYHSQGKLTAAEPLLLRAAAIIEDRLGPEHIYLTEVHRHIADLRVAQGRRDEALEGYLRSLDVARKNLAQDPEADANLVQVVTILVCMGGLYEELGESGRASACWREADDLSAAITGSTEMVELLAVRAMVLLRLGRVTDARPIVEQVLATGWRRNDLIALCEQHGLIS